MTANQLFRAAATLVGAASLMAASTAYADNTATAALSNVHIQLIDLDPNDGIAPAVTFLSPGTTLVAMTQVDGGDWVQTFITGNQGEPLGPLAAQVGSVSVSSTLLPGNLFAGAGPTVLASATVGDLNAGGWGNGHAIQSQFTLSANTRLVMTADASVNVSGAEGTAAYAYGQLVLQKLDFSSFSIVAIQASLDPGSSWPYIPAPATLQASFDNGTGVSMDGWISAIASASVTTAVPEPGSYALMLLGLGLLGHRVRRKRL